MKDEVLIIEETRELPLTGIKAMFRCRELAGASFDASLAGEVAVAVLSAHDSNAALTWASRLRAENPGLPLLFVSADREQDLSLFRVHGHGPVEVFHAHADDSDELLHRVQSLVHPEYPVVNQRIAIVLPVYNEAQRFENVRNFTGKLRDKLGTAYPNVSLFFVNDGSKDRTQELVDQVIADDMASTDAIPSYSAVSAHRLQYNSRKAGTYIQGIKSIRANVIIFADADDSFDVEDISAMINILQDGYWDMVIGTKDQTAENRSPVRTAMSFVKRMLTKPLLPAGVVDSQTGLKALSGTAATHILPYLHDTTGLAIDLEMVHIARRLNFRVLQIPVKCIDQDGSHVDIVRDGLKFLRSIVTIWSGNRQVGAPLAKALPKAGGQHA